MTTEVIKNQRWDGQDALHEVCTSAIVLPEHVIGVFHVTCSKLALAETDHSWLVPVVSQCTILDFQYCQIELFGIADYLELNLWSF